MTCCGNQIGTIITLYAQRLRPITYHLNGGTNNASNPGNYNIESDTITLQAPTRESCTFAGGTDTDLAQATQSAAINKGSTIIL